MSPADCVCLAHDALAVLLNDNRGRPVGVDVQAKALPGVAAQGAKLVADLREHVRSFLAPSPRLRADAAKEAEKGGAL